MRKIAFFTLALTLVASCSIGMGQDVQELLGKSGVVPHVQQEQEPQEQEQRQDQSQQRQQQQDQSQQQQQPQQDQSQRRQRQVQIQQRQDQVQDKIQQQSQRQEKPRVQVQVQEQRQGRSSSPIMIQTAPRKLRQERPRRRRLGPTNWKVGESWVVETKNFATPGVTREEPVAVRWTFTVKSLTENNGRSYYEVVAESEDRDVVSPIVRFWTDAETGALVRVNQSVWRSGSWRTYTESYVSRDGKPTATLASINALPLDMPIFPEEGAKDLGDDGSGTYELSTTSVAQTKDLVAEDAPLKFAYRVTQKISDAPNVDGQFGVAKGLESKDLENAVEVEIAVASFRTVKQIWTDAAPWPAYSTNGVAESRLLEVKR